MAHDYYTDTKLAWRITKDAVSAGLTTLSVSDVTGSVTSPDSLVSKAADYVAKQLAWDTFQQFIAHFEAFYLDFLRLWLTAYPRSLGKKQVDFQSILDLPDRDAIIDLVVGRELNEVLYDRPTRWFAYLEEKTKLGCPTPDEIDRIAEAKATRDVLIHNRGIANRTYESKTGQLARFKDGDRLDIPEALSSGNLRNRFVRSSPTYPTPGSRKSPETMPTRIKVLRRNLPAATPACSRRGWADPCPRTHRANGSSGGSAHRRPRPTSSSRWRPSPSSSSGRA